MDSIKSLYQKDFVRGDMALFCSFCGKRSEEVRKLIAGPTVLICNECVMLCVDIIEEESQMAHPEEVSLKVSPDDLDLIVQALVRYAAATSKQARDIAGKSAAAEAKLDKRYKTLTDLTTRLVDMETHNG